MGLKAAQEAETEIRDALRNQKIVFLCVGLGGGTGSGAAPLVTRIARELGAFIVVFATMPFEFEGKRRKDQAETALNELSVLANALVTFENSKMGELVLANQGIHEAFSAADLMISESISAVTRLVVKPGIINIGLDDLMSALDATKSRCLFGSGIAEGENRSQGALKNALNSPLLDKGAFLKSATTVLVHISGGTSLSFFEVELLMRELAKQVPEEAHILFGAAIDEAMGDKLSVTIISALPEAMLLQGKSGTDQKSAAVKSAPSVEAPAKIEKPAVPDKEVRLSTPPVQDDKVKKLEPFELEENDEEAIVARAKTQSGKIILSTVPALSAIENDKLAAKEAAQEESVEKGKVVEEAPATVIEDKADTVEEETNKSEDKEKVEELEKEKIDSSPSNSSPSVTELPPRRDLNVGVDTAEKKKKPQAELALDGGPKGKFSGEEPNLVDGEDLDIPPFLRNK